MSINTGSSKLHNSMKTLHFHWEDTKIHWNDRVRQDFEENFWALLESLVPATEREMERLAQILFRVKQDAS